MAKVQVNNNIYLCGASSKPDFDIISITVYMWGKHNFETIFISDDVLNIQDSIRKVFGSRER